MYIRVNSQNIYYQKLGEGKPLIMLHGWGNDVSSFWNIAGQLKDNFTVYLIDLPGFGRSDNPKKDFTVSDYSNLVESLIKKLNLKKPNLLGHSVGGRIAIKLAAKNPQTIDKLILEDAAGIRPKRDIPKVFFYVSTKVFKLLLPNIFNLREKVRRIFYKSLESDYINAGQLKETLKNILDEDLTAEIPKIKNQTLLIWGQKDPTLEASIKNGKKMYRLIPNARLEIFENSGHFPHLDNPKRFTYFIKDFLS